MVRLPQELTVRIVLEPAHSGYVDHLPAEQHECILGIYKGSIRMNSAVNSTDTQAE